LTETHLEQSSGVKLLKSDGIGNKRLTRSHLLDLRHRHRTVPNNVSDTTRSYYYMRNSFFRARGLRSLPKLGAQKCVCSRTSRWNGTLGHTIGAVHIPRVHLSDPMPMHTGPVIGQQLSKPSYFVGMWWVTYPLSCRLLITVTERVSPQPYTVNLE
jgi:hypothetical protein